MSTFSLACHFCQVNKAFPTFGMLGTVKHRQQIMEIDRHLNCALQPPLGSAWMDAAPIYFDFRRCCIKGFVGEFSNLPTVDGIGKIRSKSRYIKEFNAFANFFIGSEPNPQLTVRHFRMGNQVRHGADNGCNAGFVIRPEQGCAVCDYESLTFEIQ